MAGRIVSSTERFCPECDRITTRYLNAVALKDWDGALEILTDYDAHTDERHSQHNGPERAQANA